MKIYFYSFFKMNSNLKELVTQSCISANNSYLDFVLSQIQDENSKNNVKKLFNLHMEEIAIFCIENFLEKDLLNQDFIRTLHKMHFPEWYKKTKKTISGDVNVVVMIPWVYKSWHTNYDRVEPENVKKEIIKLINNYNENINLSDNKLDFILVFILNLSKIHPFWDGNGRVISILWDLMLIKNGLNPIYIKSILYKEKKLYMSIHDSIKENNTKIFLDNIKELIS